MVQVGEFVIKKDSVKRPRLNSEIDSREVRLIADDGAQLGIVKIAEALQKASELDLDLVEISPDSEPPVCRLMDYNKHLFESKKKKAEQKKKQRQVQIKEIKFRPTTEEGDYKVKLKKLIEFLEDGDKVKVTLRFRGRELAHQELGMELLKRVEQDLADYGTLEQEPNMEGRQMVMVIGQKKKGK